MTAGIHVLDVCQVGLETTRVSGLIDATSILDHEPGGVLLKRNPNIIRVRGAAGLATSRRSYPGRDQIEIEVSGTWSYNWAPWWFNLFLGPLATGTAATGAITSSSVNSPTIITTTAPHNLVDGASTTITGHTGSTPSINGTHVATVTGGSTFTIPVNVSTGGTGGTFTKADTTWAFGSSVVSDIADNLKSASVEVGGKDSWPNEYKIAGCIGNSLSLSMKQDAAWTYKATFIGTVLSIAAKTAGKTALASMVDVLGTTTKVYLNGTGSAFGVTQMAGTVISADVDIKIGSAGRYTMDAQRNPYRVGVTGPRAISAKIVMEYDAQTAYTAVHAGTAQRLRIESVGPALGSSFYKCNLDLPGTWESHDFGDDDGVVTQELTLGAQYDATPVADINGLIVNAVAVLP
jgi:hypothetical protein